MNQLNPRQINTTALAYIGDAVYEIYVRERVLGASGTAPATSGMTPGTAAGTASAAFGTAPGTASAPSGAAPGMAPGAVFNQQRAFGAHVDALHRRAIRYVRADGQARAIKAMLAEGFLTAEEEALVKRARNHKSASKPKNADAMDYKYATAFEALIGFWHLMARRGDSARAESPVHGLLSGAEQPMPAAAGGGSRRAEEGAKQRLEDIIFRAFAIIEGADAISGHGR